MVPRIATTAMPHYDAIDLVALHGPHLLGPQCCHGNRFAVERHELAFVSLALVMHQHDRPDANGLEITEVTTTVEDSSDLDIISTRPKEDHVHTHRHAAASCNAKSLSQLTG